jgi:translin
MQTLGNSAPPAGGSLGDLPKISEQLRAALGVKHAARDAALAQSRALVRFCANAIRAIHREERAEAQALLGEARSAAAAMCAAVAAFPDFLHAGYTQDGLKELVEASVLLALAADEPMPSPAQLGVEPATYLNGLAEAATELRRRILDLVRHEHSAEAERLLDAMDEIYSLLVTVDYPDAITGGLRRSTDVLRGVLERTRGDLTVSMRQQRLQDLLTKSGA